MGHSGACDISNHIIMHRVSCEVNQVLQRTLPCNCCLRKVAGHRQHCQPAIFDFFDSLVNKLVGLAAEP